MKRIGIIGGISWQSTQLYFRWLNEGVAERLGALHSAQLLISTVDLQNMHALQAAGQWDTVGARLADEAQRLEAGGADLILLASNTMHRLAPIIEAATPVPLLNLLDVTAARIKATGVNTVGLLGTRYTMEMDFYKDRLADHGITALVPDAVGRETVNQIIYDELCQGIVRPHSKAAYLDIIAALMAQGAEGLILGCTEITMLIGQHDLDIPVFDTTRIHVDAALEEALSSE